MRVDDGLAAKLHEIAVDNPAAGYRTAWAYLRHDGVLVNHKRMQRLWKEKGLTQPIRKGRKRHKGGSVPLQATHTNHVWTYDFIHDRTEDGQPLRFLTVEDEYTREGLTVATERSMPADRVIEILKMLFRERGAPEYLRSDNGPELIATKLVEWLGKQGVQTHHIDPGSPWQNAYGESFNAILRRECLNRELFYGILEARVRQNHGGNGTMNVGLTAHWGTEPLCSSVTVYGFHCWSGDILRRIIGVARSRRSDEPRRKPISTYRWYSRRGQAIPLPISVTLLIPLAVAKVWFNTRTLLMVALAKSAYGRYSLMGWLQ